MAGAKMKFMESLLKANNVPLKRIVKMGEEIPYTSFDIAELDNLMAMGGIPPLPGVPDGTFCEIFGPTGSAKSYLAQKLGVSYQKKNKAVLLIDTESAFYEPRSQMIGLNTNPDDELFMCLRNPGSAEVIANMLEEIIQSEEFGYIILDSITGLLTEDDLSKDYNESEKQMDKARFLSRFARKTVALCNDHNVTMMCVNQMRFTVDPSTINSPLKKYIIKTTGGEGVPFFAQCRFYVQKMENSTSAIVKDGERIGGKSKVTIYKSRYGRSGPDVIAEVPVYFVNAEIDPIENFLFKACNNMGTRDFIKVTRKVYTYTDETSPAKTVHCKTKDPQEFIKMLADAPAPEQLNSAEQKEGISTGFQYIARKLKLNDSDKSSILTAAYTEKVENNITNELDEEFNPNEDEGFQDALNEFVESTNKTEIK